MDAMVPQDQAVDLSRETRDLLSAVQLTEGRFGLGVPIGFLCGAHNQKLQKCRSLMQHQKFGSGKYRTQKFWKALGRSLMLEGYLREQALPRGFGATTELSRKGEEWLMKASSGSSNSRPMILVPCQDLLSELRAAVVKQAIQTGSGPRLKPDNLLQRRPISGASSVVTTATSPPAGSADSVGEPEVDPVEAKLQVELYVKLVKQRNDISQETGFTPHSIASNKVLLDLARFRPSNCKKLQEIEDLPAAKAERFGHQLTDTIREFCAQHGLSMDQFPVLTPATFSSQQPELMQLTGTQQTTYLMFVQEKKSLEEVASLRGLKTGTIVAHLCEAIRVGLMVDTRKLGLTPDAETVIASTIQSPPINNQIGSLTRIKEQLPHVEYNHIRLVIANLVARYGQTMDSEGNLVVSAPIVARVTGQVKDDDDVDWDAVEVYEVVNSSMAAPKQASKEEAASSNQHTSLPSSKLPSLSKQKSEPASETSQDVKNRLSMFQSFSQPSSSQDCIDVDDSQSQKTDANWKRKLPDWMAPAGKKVFSKKIKSNSLFR